MEDIYPEIALKQPKADPRTVLLNKRNFIESSSDHIQEYHRNSLNNTTTTTENCDKSKNIFKNTAATTTNAQICSTAAAATASLVSKTHLKSVSASSISSTSLSSSSALSSSSLLSSTESSSSSSSSSLLSTILVKFSKSCHFNASFNNNTTYLYKTQKTTKLIFFLLLIWCAILIQTTQALPARRVATSGRKLILHTNVYRERYHQKLLEEQRQHNLQQQKIQLQLLEQQQQRQRQQQTLPLHPLTIHHQHHHQQQQQQQPQVQVQKNHIFSPGQNLRRHPQPQPHHRHHLHQRAAPPSHHKMSVCKDDVIYEQLHRQMNASVSYIKNLCASYLKERGNETFEGMSETWKLISLETRNPNRKAVPVENKLHKEIVEFYLNLHNFDQLIDYASQDTNKNKTKIEHGEEINIDNITKFFETVKNEIKFNMLETNTVLDILQIEKPDLADNKVEFNSNIGRRIRDFLIIKNLIEEFERILQLVQNYCENNRSE